MSALKVQRSGTAQHAMVGARATIIACVKKYYSCVDSMAYSK